MAPMRETVGLPVLIDPEIPLYRGDIEADLCLVARDRLAERITGGLSAPSKMPCPAWGVSAARCRVGQVLAQQAGTVCHACYATRGTYGFSTVQNKLEERFHGLSNPLWTPAMIFLIRYFCGRYFRWFDSGDVLCGQPHNTSCVANLVMWCSVVSAWESSLLADRDAT